MANSLGRQMFHVLVSWDATAYLSWGFLLKCQQMVFSNVPMHSNEPAIALEIAIIQ